MLCYFAGLIRAEPSTRSLVERDPVQAADLGWGSSAALVPLTAPTGDDAVTPATTLPEVLEAATEASPPGTPGGCASAAAVSAADGGGVAAVCAVPAGLHVATMTAPADAAAVSAEFGIPARSVPATAAPAGVVPAAAAGDGGSATAVCSVSARPHAAVASEALSGSDVTAVDFSVPVGAVSVAAAREDTSGVAVTPAAAVSVPTGHSARSAGSCARAVSGRRLVDFTVVVGADSAAAGGGCGGLRELSVPLLMRGSGSGKATAPFVACPMKESVSKGEEEGDIPKKASRWKGFTVEAKERAQKILEGANAKALKVGKAFDSAVANGKVFLGKVKGRLTPACCMPGVVILGED